MSVSETEDAKRPHAELPPPAAPTKSRSFVLRHWRGDFSLPVSYWLISWLCAFIVLVVVAIGGRFIRPTDSTFEAAIAISLLWLVLLAVLTWQNVGVWRSAGKHTSRGGRAFWAVTARVMVVLGCLGMLRVLIMQAGPQIVEFWRIASGDPAIAKHELHILRSGTELEYIGGITFGATEEVRRMLDADAAIRAIHLNSQGGRIAEARLLRDLIHERGLVTYTATICASACTVAFMGGKQRMMAPTARLGFHEGAFPGVTQTEIDAQNAIDRKAMLAAGVPTWFLDKAYATPNSTMWWPTIEELKDAHVITGVAAAADFAMSGFTGVTVEDIDRQLKAMPIYAAIAKAEPETYQVILDAQFDGVKKGKSITELASVTRPYVARMAQKYLGHASDDALTEAMSVALTEIQQIGAKSPDACYNYLKPQPGVAPVIIADYVDGPTMQRDLASTAAVITTAVADPQPIPAPEDIAEARGVIGTQLRAKYSAEDMAALSNMNAPTVSHAEFCKMAGAVLAEALALPPPDRAKVLRFFYGRH